MTDSTVQRPIVWHSASKSDVGTVRKVNEDAVLSLPEKNFWAVADGMGGYAAGDIASSMVVGGLESISVNESLADTVDAIEDALLGAHTRILEYADIMLEQRTLGSTIVSFLIKGRIGICIWAGDSRLYRYRNKQLLQLSQDHSQVEELMQQGFLNSEDAADHPEANVITRAVGACEELCVDVNVFSVQVGDTFLLCSDGLYNALDLQTALSLFASHDVDEITSGLLQKALANDASDNVSMIVVKGLPGTIGKNADTPSELTAGE